jgi:hypothetical protein|nr:MAG TPA: hypothetical protein [Caudoviricetes sp.]
MKLIDILVEELPKRGGWPEGVCEISTHASGRTFFDGRFAPRGFSLPMASDAWNKYKHPHSYTNAVTREQYEAALAASKRCDHKWIPSEGRTQSGYLCSKCGNYDGPGYDWIDWPGGECPVPCGTLVDVKYLCGDVNRHIKAGEPDSSGSIDTAFAVRWSKLGAEYDIIAYRLHQPQEAEQVKADDEADLNECIGQDAAPVWNGEGLPPVGCECEFISNDTSWGAVVVIGMDGDKVVIKPSGETYYGITPSEKQVFRPIRSEADKRRDEAVKAIMLTGWCQTAAEEIYDLIAAGKVPGMKLED